MAARRPGKGLPDNELVSPTLDAKNILPGQEIIELLRGTRIAEQAPMPGGSHSSIGGD